MCSSTEDFFMCTETKTPFSKPHSHYHAAGETKSPTLKSPFQVQKFLPIISHAKMEAYGSAAAGKILL